MYMFVTLSSGISSASFISSVYKLTFMFSKFLSTLFVVLFIPSPKLAFPVFASSQTFPPIEISFISFWFGITIDISPLPFSSIVTPSGAFTFIIPVIPYLSVPSIVINFSFLTSNSIAPFIILYPAGASISSILK